MINILQIYSKGSVNVQIKHQIKENMISVTGWSYFAHLPRFPYTAIFRVYTNKQTSRREWFKLMIRLRFINFKDYCEFKNTLKRSVTSKNLEPDCLAPKIMPIQDSVYVFVMYNLKVSQCCNLI